MDNEKKEFDNTEIETNDIEEVSEVTSSDVETVEEAIEIAEEVSVDDEPSDIVNADMGAIEDVGVEDDDYTESEAVTDAVEETSEDGVVLSEEEIEPLKTSNKKVIGISACIIAVLIIAAVIYSYCSMIGVGTKTVVNTELPAQYSSAGEKLEAKEYDIKFKNPLLALVDGENEETLTVNGYSMSADLFSFFAKTNSLNYVAQLYQTGAEVDLKNFDWSAKDEETGLEIAEIVKGETVKSMAAPVAIIGEAAKRGVSLTEEDEKSITDWLEQTKTQLGEDFENALKASGYDNEEQLVEAQKFNLLYQKAYEAFTNEPLSYVQQYEGYEKYLSDDQVTVQHVLITFPDGVTRESTEEEKAETKKTAEEVLSKANAGEDFASLVDTYNQDPGQGKYGYTFANDGSMVQEFADAAFDLEIGGISGLVETDYGYHIIKRTERIPSADEYFAIVEDNMKIRINKSAYFDIAFEKDLTLYFGDPTASEESETSESNDAEAGSGQSEASAE